jgi:hypothetical protein
MNQFSPRALDYSIQRMWQLMMIRTSISLGLALLCWSVRMPLPGQRRSITPNSYYKYAPGTNSISMALEDCRRCYHSLTRAKVFYLLLDAGFLHGFFFDHEDGGTCPSEASADYHETVRHYKEHAVAYLVQAPWGHWIVFFNLPNPFSRTRPGGLLSL